jgi:hypothetical protein
MYAVISHYQYPIQYPIETMKNLICFLSLLVTSTSVFAQGPMAPSIGVQAGMMNYLGDLNPNSFTFTNTNAFTGVYLTKPLTTKVNLRAGVAMGKIGAADKYNRGYLVPRNLSFESNIRDIYAGFEWSVISSERSRISPYLFLAGGIFHFNPYTYDQSGQKVYLQPLSTEGQGLNDYPDRKVYDLTQFNIIYAGGIRYQVNDNITVAIELSQRKTFTDYLDDVSSNYVDRDKLMAARGAKAVELAFRGDELTPQAYPKAGEQRGTPTETDWYYLFGVNVEVKLSAIGDKLRSGGLGSRSRYGCPAAY